VETQTLLAHVEGRSEQTASQQALCFCSVGVFNGDRLHRPPSGRHLEAA